MTTTENKHQDKRCEECGRQAATNMHGRCAWCEAEKRNAAQNVERVIEKNTKKRA